MDTLFLALRVLVSLAAVLAVIWYAHRRLTKNSHAAKVANPITVVSRQGLSQKSSVVIVEAEGKRFVLGVTEHNVSVLYERDSEPVLVAQPADDFALPADNFALASPVVDETSFAHPHRKECSAGQFFRQRHGSSPSPP